jgi:cation diffusion facilitator CzcD-associated flavoprotein CzcO
MASGHLKKSVKDKELRARLTPDFVIGCKRILFSNTWYPAIQQPNVEIVSDGIQEVRPHSIVTVDGHEREVDTIIFGTGFQPTKRSVADLVAGRDGRTVAQAWADGMTAYRGTTIAGFPNLFMLLGPGTTSAHTSMTVMAEAQINYVLDALRTMEEQAVAAVDVRPEVQSAYNDKLQTMHEGTVWAAGGCNSWYLDSQGRNTTLWPTFSWRFRKITKRFDLASYEVSTPAAQPRHEVPQSV